MQLLPGDKVRRSQVPGERFGNKLSHLLWFFVYIKCDCTSTSMWTFYAFGLLPGLYMTPFSAVVPVLSSSPTFGFYTRKAGLSVLNVIFHSIYCLRHTLAATMFAPFVADLWEIWQWVNRILTLVHLLLHSYTSLSADGWSERIDIGELFAIVLIYLRVHGYFWFLFSTCFCNQVYFGMLDALLASEELPEEFRDRCQVKHSDLVVP